MLAWGVPSHTMGWSRVPKPWAIWRFTAWVSVASAIVKRGSTSSGPQVISTETTATTPRACSVPVAPTVMTTSSCARAPSGVRATSADTQVSMRASGKTTGVYFRWAANRQARKALTAFAHNARMQSPWAGRLYADARARGKRNPHATTRIVARAWLRVIWACWHATSGTHAHLAEQRLAAA